MKQDMIFRLVLEIILHSKISLVSKINPFLFPSNYQIRLLSYHHVYDDSNKNPDISGIPVSCMKRQFQWLLRNGYTFITASDALDCVNKQNRLYRCIVITTDDGSIDNYNVMAPLFEEFCIKPILFINSSNIGKPHYMSRLQIKELIAMGYEIGSHTASHINCTNMTDQIFTNEIVRDIQLLQDLQGAQVRFFAFPYGKIFKENLYINKLTDEGIEMCLSVRFMFKNNLSPLCWGRDKGEFEFNKFILLFYFRPYILSFINSIRAFDNRCNAFK
ncbi:MAG: polysaccharide deacetylase family protein [Saprospiraceae bacterium]|nr:polysaccharide deacetylase family protein [Saprospiraceae bacterium]